MSNEPFLTSNDGWNKKQLGEAGLFDILSDFSRMEYELKNCRRGAYAISGDTAQDLIDDLYLMRDKLSDTITTINEMFTRNLINR
jgi:hypothetical protein